jgi:hypothetical protein
MIDAPFKTVEKRNPDGTFAPGHPGGPGRPKGKTLKEFAREYLLSLSDEKKQEFLASLPKEFVWKMAEGGPQTHADITSKGKEVPIITGTRVIYEENTLLPSTNSE